MYHIYNNRLYKKGEPAPLAEFVCNRPDFADDLVRELNAGCTNAIQVSNYSEVLVQLSMFTGDGTLRAYSDQPEKLLEILDTRAQEAENVA